MPVASYPIDPSRLSDLVQRYQSHSSPPIGYGTVRDFCDSVTHLPELTSNRDLKDVQRPWMFKSIVARIPRGGHLLEIGAGDPHVAHWLACAGYHVTIVDPYDGSGNGPTDYDYYREHFPHLQFRREVFGDSLAGIAPGSIDCIYSISVLEHVPHEHLAKVITGIRRYQRPGRPTIHAVDHVHKGRGEERHRRTLELLNAGFGLPAAGLHSALQDATEDPETYFLSAESHNLWRGGMDYDSFPMRRCISVQFCSIVV
jgi:hypothetical protein